MDYPSAFSGKIKCGYYYVNIIYILNKSQLFEEFKEYILTYKTQPNVKCKEGRVVYMCFQNENEERVVVNCGMDKVGYDKLQQECLKYYALLVIKKKLQKNSKMELKVSLVKFIPVSTILC